MSPKAGVLAVVIGVVGVGVVAALEPPARDEQRQATRAWREQERRRRGRGRLADVRLRGAGPDFLRWDL